MCFSGVVCYMEPTCGATPALHRMNLVFVTSLPLSRLQQFAALLKWIWSPVTCKRNMQISVMDTTDFTRGRETPECITCLSESNECCKQAQGWWTLEKIHSPSNRFLFSVLISLTASVSTNLNATQKVYRDRRCQVTRKEKQLVSPGFYLSGCWGYPADATQNISSVFLFTVNAAEVNVGEMELSCVSCRSMCLCLSVNPFTAESHQLPPAARSLFQSLTAKIR